MATLSVGVTRGWEGVLVTGPSPSNSNHTPTSLVSSMLLVSGCFMF